ncbi:hypothetical protein SEA_LAKSHMI_40 [Arthrobacter phage Lakshmi]|uniref:Minor tail protein n=1 Tax=Arthrobacter phage Lakshmi TaxID=3062829 RepID=A0AB38YAQ0_9CAUD|nr:hypothetical protein SEA_LAKSHMI_40 [Arthrobacter phage Lakshmi]
MDLPDSILLAFALIFFFAALFLWGRWREEVTERERAEALVGAEEQALRRLYRRFLVAREIAFADYNQRAIWSQEFTFPTFAEWIEDRGEDN